jgi:O-acetyl-ADP-ribose deacetylase (regulator of RNase III)
LIKLAEEGHFDVIVHGCNCFNNMGAGIARTIAEKFPQAYEADKRTIRGDKSKLGTFSSALCTTKTNPVSLFTIINAYTQYSPAYGKDVFEYDAFKTILKTLSELEEMFNTRIGFPLIGCGLAGGNKKKILTMIEEFETMVAPSGNTVTVVEFHTNLFL